MAYSDVPVDANEAFSVSQPKIKENFTVIDTAFKVDHEAFDAAAAYEGKHKKVTLTEQTDQATLVNEIALYAKDAGTEPNLYLRKENSGAVFNLTPSTTGHIADGYEVLPSGLIMKWGLKTATGLGTVVYPIAFPTATLSVQLTPYGTDAANMNRSIRLRGYAGKLSFTVVATRRYQNDLDTCQFTYLAIGY